MITLENFLSSRLPAKRHTLYLLGGLLSAAGIVAIVAPFLIFASVTTIVGVVLIVAGLLKAVQFFLGLRRGGVERRGFFLIAGHVALDVGLGVLILTYNHALSQVVQWIVAALVVADGLIQMVIGLRAPRVASRWIFVALGLATVGLALAIPFTPIRLEQSIGFYVGLRLGMFGGALLLVAKQSPPGEDPIYRSGRPDEVERVRGEAYAGYFGAAYHLGIYIGDETVVHYTDQNVVSRVGWDEFCKGRATQRWDYPDVERATVDEIVQTALEQVGRESTYDLFRNNCEHFAIYCLSGGKTRTSKFAQIDASISNLTSRPVLGPLLEVYARAVEKLAFGMGGMFGRNTALAVRRFTSVVTMWLVSRQRSYTPSP